jgi:hypothetical protein
MASKMHIKKAAHPSQVNGQYLKINQKWKSRKAAKINSAEKAFCPDAVYLLIS